MLNVQIEGSMGKESDGIQVFIVMSPLDIKRTSFHQSLYITFFQYLPKQNVGILNDKKVHGGWAQNHFIKVEHKKQDIRDNLFCTVSGHNCI